MDIAKSLVCLLLFLGAVFGAVWPIASRGEVDWLLDMDIRGGVQIVYRADFSKLPPHQQTTAERRRLMESSHLRLDARLAKFQGADVRVQRLGKDRLLVEVPGVDNIAQVRADLGHPKVVNFARVTSVAPQRDETHPYEWNLGDSTLGFAVADRTDLGGQILYEQMEVELDASPDEKGFRKYQVSLPLDVSGTGKISVLTNAAFDHPVEIASGTEPIPLIAFFLDDEPQDVFLVKDRAIRQGALTQPDHASAETLKKLLSSGPMPIPFSVDSEHSIHPLVGRSLQTKGVLALLFSVVLLIVFVALCYLDRPWFIFVYSLTLLFWFLCFLTMANLHLFRISLLQLAGFALLLGMNTDSLVLVFEDLREHGEDRRFRLDLVGEAFKTEWSVIFWGMLTTVAMVLPLMFQGGVFADYVKLILLGMVINVLGFIFARLLMALPISAEISKLRFPLRGIVHWFSRLDLTGQWYFRATAVLVPLALIAVFLYPRIPVAPIFAGGKAIELRFDRPVQRLAFEEQVKQLFGASAETLTEGDDEGIRWALVKLPQGTSGEDRFVSSLETSLGVTPSLSSVQEISRSLVAQTKLKVSFEMFLGLLALLVISVVIYNLTAGWLVFVALLHDLLLCLGAMALLRIHLDLPAIAALSVVIGYSANDSIVILHKLKELKLQREAARRKELDPLNEEDRSILSGLRLENLRRIPARVLITSLTTALPMLIMALFVGGVFWGYSMILLAGIVFGTLSSIYIVGRSQPLTGYVKYSS